MYRGPVPRAGPFHFWAGRMPPAESAAPRVPRPACGPCGTPCGQAVAPQPTGCGPSGRDGTALRVARGPRDENLFDFVLPIPI
jgi:hypothetical protein